jgi:hypothetical protein
VEVLTQKKTATVVARSAERKTTSLRPPPPVRRGGKRYVTALLAVHADAVVFPNVTLIAFVFFSSRVVASRNGENV